jgi:hypothetical protein
MLAECSAQTLNVEAGSTLICIDFISVLILWFGLLFAKHSLSLTEDSLLDFKLSASDFTVHFQHESKEERLDDMHAIYWEWAEYILKQQRVVYTHPKTGMVDLNQNNVANVFLGLNNFNFRVQCRDL